MVNVLAVHTELCTLSIGFIVTSQRFTKFAGYVSMTLLLALRSVSPYFSIASDEFFHFLNTKYSLDLRTSSDCSLCRLFLLLHEEVYIRCIISRVFVEAYFTFSWTPCFNIWCKSADWMAGTVTTYSTWKQIYILKYFALLIFQQKLTLAKYVNYMIRTIHISKD